MTIEAIDFARLYRDHLAIAARTRKTASAWDPRAAGMAAHLAGAVAARTMKPVIGIPVAASPLGGMDALLATVQMPPGFPVATVALDKAGARNAAWLAAQILALHDPELAHKIRISRERFKSDVAVAGAEIEAKYC